jgi:hypothetical protein
MPQDTDTTDQGSDTTDHNCSQATQGDNSSQPVAETALKAGDEKPCLPNNGSPQFKMEIEESDTSEDDEHNTPTKETTTSSSAQSVAATDPKAKDGKTSNPKKQSKPQNKKKQNKDGASATTTIIPTSTTAAKTSTNSPALPTKTAAHADATSKSLENIQARATTSLATTEEILSQYCTSAPAKPPGVKVGAIQLKKLPLRPWSPQFITPTGVFITGLPKDLSELSSKDQEIILEELCTVSRLPREALAPKALSQVPPEHSLYDTTTRNTVYLPCTTDVKLIPCRIILVHLENELYKRFCITFTDQAFATFKDFHYPLYIRGVGGGEEACAIGLQMIEAHCAAVHQLEVIPIIIDRMHLVGTPSSPETRQGKSVWHRNLLVRVFFRVRQIHLKTSIMERMAPNLNAGFAAPLDIDPLYPMEVFSNAFLRMNQLLPGKPLVQAQSCLKIKLPREKEGILPRVMTQILSDDSPWKSQLAFYYRSRTPATYEQVKLTLASEHDIHSVIMSYCPYAYDQAQSEARACSLMGHMFTDNYPHRRLAKMLIEADNEARKAVRQSAQNPPQNTPQPATTTIKQPGFIFTPKKPGSPAWTNTAPQATTGGNLPRESQHVASTQIHKESAATSSVPTAPLTGPAPSTSSKHGQTVSSNLQTHNVTVDLESKLAKLGESIKLMQEQSSQGADRLKTLEMNESARTASMDRLQAQVAKLVEANLTTAATVTALQEQSATNTKYLTDHLQRLENSVHLIANLLNMRQPAIAPTFHTSQPSNPFIYSGTSSASIASCTPTLTLTGYSTSTSQLELQRIQHAISNMNPMQHEGDPLSAGNRGDDSYDSSEGDLQLLINHTAIAHALSGNDDLTTSATNERTAESASSTMSDSPSCV